MGFFIIIIFIEIIHLTESFVINPNKYPKGRKHRLPRGVSLEWLSKCLYMHTKRSSKYRLDIHIWSHTQPEHTAYASYLAKIHHEWQKMTELNENKTDSACGKRKQRSTVAVSLLRIYSLNTVKENQPINIKAPLRYWAFRTLSLKCSSLKEITRLRKSNFSLVKAISLGSFYNQWKRHVPSECNSEKIRTGWLLAA